MANLPEIYSITVKYNRKIEFPLSIFFVPIECKIYKENFLKPILRNLSKNNSKPIMVNETILI